MSQDQSGRERQLHFDQAEYEGRLTRLRARMAEQDLDAMLLFAQESQYWLSGYDTFGFCFFQCLVVRHDGPLTLLTRSADFLQAAYTSVIEDVRVWRDGADADPTANLAAILAEAGLEGARLGVEFDTHGLTAHNYRRLAARLGGWAALVDASDVVSKLRLVKSPAEIGYVRRAARIADAAFESALPQIRAGADEALILAALQGEIYARGGDYPANPFIVGSGPVSPGVSGALLCRYYSGRRTLSPSDQLTLEWAGVYRQYHAALMRTVVVGRPTVEHRTMHAAARDALMACEETLSPDRTMGEVFAAHAETLDRSGFGHARLNACGYALGARYAPSWMEREMFFENAPTVLQPNMVFFLHMILMDHRSGAALSLGRTSVVTTVGSEPLSSLSLELDIA